MKEQQIEHIITAITSHGNQETAKLIKKSIDIGIRTQTIPLNEDIMTGKLSVKDIKDVKIEDLFGLEEVQLDMNKSKAS